MIFCVFPLRTVTFTKGSKSYKQTRFQGKRKTTTQYSSPKFSDIYVPKSNLTPKVGLQLCVTF